MEILLAVLLVIITGMFALALYTFDRIYQKLSMIVSNEFLHFPCVLLFEYFLG
jgi:hypothetical protein